MRFHQDHLGGPGSWHFFKGQQNLVGGWWAPQETRRTSISQFQEEEAPQKKKNAALPGWRQDLMYGYLRCISAIYKLVEKPMYDEFTKDSAKFTWPNLYNETPCNPLFAPTGRKIEL